MTKTLKSTTRYNTAPFVYFYAMSKPNTKLFPRDFLKGIKRKNKIEFSLDNIKGAVKSMSGVAPNCSHRDELLTGIDSVTGQRWFKYNPNGTARFRGSDPSLKGGLLQTVSYHNVKKSTFFVKTIRGFLTLKGKSKKK